MEHELKQKQIDEDINVRSKTEIEEMAQCKNSFGFTCNECFTKVCERYVLAEELYNAGYRKIPENAVVLTGGEYSGYLVMKDAHQNAIERCEKLQADNERLYKNIGKFKDAVRKETAEKFAEMASKAFMNVNCIDIDEWNWYQRKIDEICKEITEGKV